jgi:SagB-type dehydrogenase family enzyme
MAKQIGSEFMKKTCPQHIDQSDQEKGLPQPPLELPFDAQAKLIDLPNPHEINIPAINLQDAIENRRSIRRYDQTQSISLDELSFLLWATQGIKEFTPRPVTLRTVPSAGARHAFETFLLINRVDTLQPGLYRYIASEHALILIDDREDVADRITEASFNQRMVFNSAVTFMWVAVTYRMAWRYGQRGYRYLHLDAGHVCQNLYLAAEPINCGMVAIAAFNDDQINHELSLNGDDQFVIYMASLGKKEPK